MHSSGFIWSRRTIPNWCSSWHSTLKITLYMTSTSTCNGAVASKLASTLVEPLLLWNGIIGIGTGTTRRPPQPKQYVFIYIRRRIVAPLLAVQNADQHLWDHVPPWHSNLAPNGGGITHACNACFLHRNVTATTGVGACVGSYFRGKLISRKNCCPGTFLQSKTFQHSVSPHTQVFCSSKAFLSGKMRLSAVFLHRNPILAHVVQTWCTVHVYYVRRKRNLHHPLLNSCA